jgi:hypothetical protein
LEIKYRASDLELYYGDIDIPDEVKNKNNTLRAVTKLFNKHPVKQKDISKNALQMQRQMF